MAILVGLLRCYGVRRHGSHKMFELYVKAVYAGAAGPDKLTPANVQLSATNRTAEAVLIENVPDFEKFYSHEVCWLSMGVYKRMCGPA